MKICIPTKDSQGLQGKVFGHFGSAPTFTLIDLDTMQVDILTSQNSHHDHGQCVPVSLLSEQGIHAVICRGMGRNAVNRLAQEGIEVFITQEDEISNILTQFKNGQIPKITLDQACQGHG